MEKQIRCPHCAGIKVLIDRFNHNHFYDCPLCKGKGKLMINHPNLEDQRAEGNEGRPSDFVDELGFGQKLRMTWRGQNDFGRIGGTVLDIAESFLPKYVSQTRNLLQKTTNTMDKPKLKSKSIQGVVGLLITVILQVLGVDVTGDPELMNDIYHILYGLSGFWSVFGLRDALGKIITKQEGE